MPAFMLAKERVELIEEGLRQLSVEVGRAEWVERISVDTEHVKLRVK